MTPQYKSVRKVAPEHRCQGCPKLDNIGPQKLGVSKLDQMHPEKFGAPKLDQIDPKNWGPSLIEFGGQPTYLN